MTIQLFYNAKNQPMFKVNGEEGLLSELGLGIMFGNNEQTISLLGKVKPDVELLDDDEKMRKHADELNALLNAFYRQNG